MNQAHRHHMKIVEDYETIQEYIFNKAAISDEKLLQLIKKSWEDDGYEEKDGHIVKEEQQIEEQGILQQALKNFEEDDLIQLEDKKMRDWNKKLLN